MHFNTVIITEPHWRQLPAELRAQLRRRLGGKDAIVGCQVLDMARALCDRGALDVAFDLYRALQGEPLTPYQGCGFGLMMHLRELMGEAEAPDPGETLLLRP